MAEPQKKIFFASDFHLGAPNHRESLVREKKVVEWLNWAEPQMEELYLLGDMFDFWFEYKNVVPKGYVRLLGKLAFLADRGIPIHIFVGNHDLWMGDYLQQEFGAHIYFEPLVKKIKGKTFYLAHGDGLGPGDAKFKMLKKMFTNPTCQRMFRWLHPSTGIDLANFFSRRSRNSTGQYDSEFLGEDKEFLILHSKNILEKKNIDYFIYGHRHYPITFGLSGGSKMINLGDWINHFTFGEFDGQNFSLREFDKVH